MNNIGIQISMGLHNVKNSRTRIEITCIQGKWKTDTETFQKSETT